jgi:hypothetical protein
LSLTIKRLRPFSDTLLNGLKECGLGDPLPSG